MRTNRLLIRAILIVVFLSGCASQSGSVASLPVPPDVTPTLTPFLPASDTPTYTAAPATDIPTPTITAAPTLAPTATPTPSMRVNLEAVGDIMLARTVGDQVKAKGPEIVFAGVQSVLDSADVLVGNLECALTTSSEQQTKSYTFAAPPEAAQALALAGFDVLSLANNHVMDYGSQGLFDTRDNLALYDIASVGAGANTAEAHTPVILERNGLRLAFLAYADVMSEITGFNTRTWIASASHPGIAWADLDQIAVDVTAARAQADVVVVQLHGGYEVNKFIPVVTSSQQAEARAAIDAGASLVIGSHPHTLQSIERYHGGLIAYSLGNFVFDDYQGIANATVILRVVLTPSGVESFDYVPVLIKNGLPEITSIDNARGIETLVAP